MYTEWVKNKNQNTPTHFLRVAFTLIFALIICKNYKNDILTLLDYKNKAKKGD